MIHQNVLTFSIKVSVSLQAIFLGRYLGILLWLCITSMKEIILCCLALNFLLSGIESGTIYTSILTLDIEKFNLKKFIHYELSNRIF